MIALPSTGMVQLVGAEWIPLLAVVWLITALAAITLLVAWNYRREGH